MRNVPLGNTGQQVSALCLGAMNFGTKTDDATSRRLLDIYVESGGRFIDTANVYAVWSGGKGGDSEAVIGRWLRDRGNRDGLILATKVGSRLQPSGRGLRPQQVREECDKSLRLLGIETLDLYYAHFYDPVTPIEESLGAFEELRRAGKIRHIGASNYPAWRLAEANTAAAARGLPGYCCIQQRLSYLQPAQDADFGVQMAANPELLDYCRQRGVTVLAYSPLLGGLYGRTERKLDARYATPRNEARLRALDALATQKGLSANTLVLAWMLHANPPVLPIVAASSEAQLRQNLSALDVKLTAQEMELLDKAA